MSTIHAHKNPHAHPVHAHQLGGGKGKHPSHGARLTFHIATGTLSGTAGGKSVTMHAFSGGGGGS